MTLASMHEFLTGVVEYQPWRERANCRGLSPSLFFVERGDSVNEAKAVCAGCEVRQECLDFAQSNMERYGGVWGGLSDRQRRALRREEGLDRSEVARRAHIGLRLRGTHPRRDSA